MSLIGVFESEISCADRVADYVSILSRLQLSMTCNTCCRQVNYKDRAVFAQAVISEARAELWQLSVSKENDNYLPMPKYWLWQKKIVPVAVFQRTGAIASILLDTSCLWWEYLETTGYANSITEHRRYYASKDSAKPRETFNYLLRGCMLREAMETEGGGVNFSQYTIPTVGIPLESGKWSCGLHSLSASETFHLVLSLSVSVEAPALNIDLTHSSDHAFCSLLGGHPAYVFQ